MTPRTNFLAAVLVPANATTDTVGSYLAGAMRALMPGVVDRYRLGGEFTGAWDPGYEPRTDPVNWRPCTDCAATGVLESHTCPTCGDAAQQGRTAGTILAGPENWAAHPGDIVPLTRLLEDSWRYPPLPNSDSAQPVRFSAPSWYADEYGTTVVGFSRGGETPRELQTIWQYLLVGQRLKTSERVPVDPAQWAVAVVDAHRSPDEIKATMPTIGSVVLITDPDWIEADAEPDQLYVVSDDFDDPYYTLVRLGGYGPQVPGYALTEVDPFRVRPEPAPDGAPPYPPRPAAADNPPAVNP